MAQSRTRRASRTTSADTVTGRSNTVRPQHDIFNNYGKRSRCLSSNERMASLRSSVIPLSSSPFSRQSRRNGSTSNGHDSPFGRSTVHASKSITRRSPPLRTSHRTAGPLETRVTRLAKQSRSSGIRAKNIRKAKAMTARSQSLPSPTLHVPYLSCSRSFLEPIE